MEKYFTLNYAVKKLRKGKRIKRVNLSQYSIINFNPKNWQKVEDK